MPFADDLLEQSLHLANREPKRPRQASLRRAISTAYYALFRLLTAASVSNWKNVRQRAALARAFEHSRMKNACSRTESKRVPDPKDPSVRHSFPAPCRARAGFGVVLLGPRPSLHNLR
jgi:hypothetical protein